MTKHVSEWMTLPQCLKAYSLYMHHEKKGLIKIHSISIDQEELDEPFVKTYTGRNKGTGVDVSRHQLSVEFEKIDNGTK